MSKNKSGRGRQQPIPTSPTSPIFENIPEFVWNDLDELYARLVPLCTFPARLGTLLGDRDVVAALPDVKAVTERAKIFAADLDVYARRLMGIHARHRGRTGPITNADENLVSIQIFEAYVQWEASYQSVIMPNLLFIQEQFAAVVEPVHS
jgi:hypothetical protein